MITVQDLLDNNYNLITVSSPVVMMSATALYQKCVKSNDQTRYFINAYIYPNNIEFKVYSNVNDMAVQVHLYNIHKSLKEVEDTIEHIFTSSNFDNYDC